MNPLLLLLPLAAVAFVVARRSGAPGEAPGVEVEDAACRPLTTFLLTGSDDPAELARAILACREAGGTAEQITALLARFGVEVDDPFVAAALSLLDDETRQALIDDASELVTDVADAVVDIVGAVVEGVSGIGSAVASLFGGEEFRSWAEPGWRITAVAGGTRRTADPSPFVFARSDDMPYLIGLFRPGLVADPTWPPTMTEDAVEKWWPEALDDPAAFFAPAPLVNPGNGINRSNKAGLGEGGAWLLRREDTEGLTPFDVPDPRAIEWFDLRVPERYYDWRADLGGPVPPSVRDRFEMVYGRELPPDGVTRVPTVLLEREARVFIPGKGTRTRTKGLRYVVNPTVAYQDWLDGLSPIARQTQLAPARGSSTEAPVVVAGREPSPDDLEQLPGLGPVAPRQRDPGDPGGFGGFGV